MVAVLATKAIESLFHDRTDTHRGSKQAFLCRLGSLARLLARSTKGSRIGATPERLQYGLETIELNTDASADARPIVSQRKFRLRSQFDVLGGERAPEAPSTLANARRKHDNKRNCS